MGSRRREAGPHASGAPRGNRPGPPELAVHRRSPAGAWHVFVDAHAERFLRADSLWNAARGRVYLESPLHGGVTTLELPGIDGELLEGPYGWTASCIGTDPNSLDCDDLVQLAEPNEDGDFLYDPDPESFDDPFAEAQLYYHLALISRWFDTEYGFVHDEPLPGIVAFDVANAFFGDLGGDGRYEIVFGKTEGIDLAYDADVVYHEFGHSVLHGLGIDSGPIADEYGFDRAPRALHEGSSDLIAVLQTDDPNLGEYTGAAFGEGDGIRNLEDDLKCPRAIGANDHVEGIIWGSLGWNLIDDPLLGPELVGDLLYGATSSWPSAPTWAIAGQSLVETASDLFDAGLITAAQSDAVIAHGEESGVIGCGRVLALDEGAAPLYGLWHVAWDEGYTTPLPLQFSLHAPAGATSVDFRLDDFFVAAGALGWKIFMRRGEHVVFETVDGPTYPHHEPVIYDDVVNGSGPYQYQLRLAGDPPLEPDATYYFALTSWEPPVEGEEFGVALVSVSGYVQDEATRVLWPEEEGSGCAGCGGSISGGAAAPAVLLVLMISVRRRFPRGGRPVP